MVCSDGGMSVVSPLLLSIYIYIYFDKRVTAVVLALKDKTPL